MKMAAHDGEVPGIKYGTVQYLAPEVLNTHIMTKKADVYSFGIIMWEVWHSRLFAEFYNNEKRKRKQCEPYDVSEHFCCPAIGLTWCSVLWSCESFYFMLE
jgi:serine/threonine protein kinase